MDIITRQEAKAQGLKRYFTGKPCLQRHVSERQASNGNCCQCDLERKQTPERKAKSAAQKADYYATNTERLAAYKAEYRKLNTERIAAQNAAYYKLNTERIAAKKAAYSKANPHIRNAIAAARRAQKLQATPSWADFEAIKAIYEQASFMSKVLGEKQHVDHIYPLISDKVCGLHVAANLQILSATDNIKKSNKFVTVTQIN